MSRLRGAGLSRSIEDEDVAHELRRVWLELEPAPTELVPGVSIGASGDDHTVSWDVATAGLEADYQVRVEWYVDGVMDGAADTVRQEAGQAERNLTAASSIHARVAYVSKGGAGPFRATSVI